METEKEKNAIRAVLRNEITWVLFIVGGVIGMVTGVVVPLNTQKTQIEQINNTLAEINKKLDKNIDDNIDLATRVTILETKTNKK